MAGTSGMSQAIATTPRPALACSAASSPVSGWRGSLGSLSTRQSSGGSGDSGLATTIGSSPAEPTVEATRATSGRPASSTIAFGSPMRLLRPPASTAPTITARPQFPPPCASAVVGRRSGRPV